MNNTGVVRNALITGASSGIGYELARVFACQGHNLVLVARDLERLDQSAQQLRQAHEVRVVTLAKDLSISTAPQQIANELRSLALPVHVMVNNAGYAVYGKFAETDLHSELEMMQVNMVALTHLTKLFLPQMIERQDGKILSVASTAAFQPGPLMAVYYASKAYVLSFSEALSHELEGTGVTASCLCPGPTKTGFAARARMQDSKLFQGSFPVMDAAEVAEIAYR